MDIGNYKLESDALNITLSEGRVSKKTGREYFTPVAYFATPQNALKFLADHELRVDGFKSLETITKKLREIYTLIDSLKNLPTINNKPEREPREKIAPALTPRPMMRRTTINRRGIKGKRGSKP